MSTIIIGGGGGHAAIDRAVAASPKMDPNQLRFCQALIDLLARELNCVCDEVEQA